VHKYLLRRVLITIPTLIGISLVLFTVLAMAPGDPFEELALNPNIPAEVRLNLRHQFGLDDPIQVRYVRWFTSMLRGDWGYSFVSRVDVDRLILQRLPTTLFVLGTAYGLALLIALPVGVISAVRPYSLFDQIATTLAFVGHSLPTFFTGLLFILLFSLYLDWLPFIYSTTIEATGIRWVVEHLRQAAMPIAVLALFEAASLTRFVRASMLDVIHQDFVTTARAKGLTERRTVLWHVLRNALIPVITIVALQLPGIFTGAVITEQIFRVPGIGSLLIAAIQSTDTPVVMAITFVYAMLVVVFNLVADIIYGFLDPRITYS
jgi:peptide/nickel transport system permease protein